MKLVVKKSYAISSCLCCLAEKKFPCSTTGEVQNEHSCSMWFQKGTSMNKKENLLPPGSNRFNLIRFFSFEEGIQGADLPLVIFVGFYCVVAIEFLN
jgi:hypothetical protein